MKRKGSKHNITRILFLAGTLAVTYFYLSQFSFLGHPQSTLLNHNKLQQLLDLDQRSDKQLRTIPKKIHQTWSSKYSLPTNYEKWSQSCKDLHPSSQGWQYTFWDEEANLELVRIKFPWFLDTYQAFTLPESKVDAIRYMVLYLDGGFFFDLDFECLKPLDIFLSKDVVMAFLSYEVTAGNLEHALPNAFIGSRPKMIKTDVSLSELEKAGGSQFLYTSYVEWLRIKKFGTATFDFVNPDFIYPYDWRISGNEETYCSAKKETFDEARCKELIFKDAFMIKYWDSTLLKQKFNK